MENVEETVNNYVGGCWPRETMAQIIFVYELVMPRVFVTGVLLANYVTTRLSELKESLSRRKYNAAD